MKVILRSDRKGLGKRGDIVEVSDGHARNFLLPKGHALKASDGAVSQAASMRRSRDLRDAQDRESAQTIASALVPKVISIPAKSGPEGKLYGSVTSADVAHAVEEQTKVVIDRKNLHMDPIKSLGTHTVTAKLHSDVEFLADGLQQFDGRQSRIQHQRDARVLGQLLEQQPAQRGLAGAHFAGQLHEAAAATLTDAIQQVRERIAMALAEEHEARIGRDRIGRLGQAVMR